MRKDMNKVLTERPRYGHSRNYHEVRRNENSGELEDLPHFQGMRAPYESYDGRKEFSDLLGPLKRFIHGCIGRRYDDVWSEICQAVPSGNTVDDHLKGHARREIETNTYIEDEQIFYRSRFGTGRVVSGLYVDPRDGIIYDATNRVSRKKQNENIIHIHGVGYFKKDIETGILHSYYNWRYGTKQQYRMKIVGDNEAIQMNGIWYWMTYDFVPSPYFRIRSEKDDDGNWKKVIKEEFPTKNDFFTGATIKSGNRYRSGRLQMNSRDLKKNGLANDDGDLPVSFPRH